MYAYVAVSPVCLICIFLCGYTRFPSFSKDGHSDITATYGNLPSSAPLHHHLASTTPIVKSRTEMTFPPNADENAQVAWPEPVSPVVERDSLQVRRPQGQDPERQNTTTTTISKSGEKRFGWRDFINISISMAGAQIAWTLELGYGVLHCRVLSINPTCSF